MSEAQLIHADAKGDKLLLSGPVGVCLQEAAKLAQSGKGPLEVWHRTRGVVQSFSGNLANRNKRLEASKAAQARSIEARQADAVLTARKVQTAKAEAEVVRAKERLEAAESREGEADAMKQVAEKKAAPATKKKAAKKKAAKNSS
jgi:hypothetical protein|tara:strand:+ start:364 stop:798 length:435 start_codon:yes stop_codon:yes gene_type:complete